MCKKISVLLLSFLLLVTFSVAFASPGFVMAAVGMAGTDKVGLFEKVEAKTLKAIKADIDNLAVEMGKSNATTFSSGDKIVNVAVKKCGENITVHIMADGSKLPEFSYKDFSKVTKLAEDYLKPIMNEKQTRGLCSLFLSDAYEQYKKGVVRIILAKEDEGITIECSGNTNSGLFSVSLISEFETKESLPIKRKIPDNIVLPH